MGSPCPRVQDLLCRNSKRFPAAPRPHVTRPPWMSRLLRLMPQKCTSDRWDELRRDRREGIKRRIRDGNHPSCLSGTEPFIYFGVFSHLGKKGSHHIQFHALQLCLIAATTDVPIQRDPPHKEPTVSLPCCSIQALTLDKGPTRGAPHPLCLERPRSSDRAKEHPTSTYRCKGGGRRAECHGGWFLRSFCQDASRETFISLFPFFLSLHFLDLQSRSEVMTGKQSRYK